MANLLMGSMGPEVRDLQTQLNAKFRPTPLLAVDGIFGPKTSAATRGFQTKSHLTPDGIVGPKTRAALAAAPSVGPGPGPAPAPPPLPKPQIGPYTVPSPVYIAQDKKNSCWFASGQMLIQWKRNRTNMTDSRHPDPSESEKWSKVYTDDGGITNGQIKAFANDMGLEMVPPMSPTPEAILGWLSTFGPLWVNGVKHITVIVGIRGPREDTEVLVFDPADKANPGGTWRNLRTWYVLNGHSGRDTSGAVEAVFLRLP